MRLGTITTRHASPLAWRPGKVGFLAGDAVSELGESAGSRLPWCSAGGSSSAVGVWCGVVWCGVVWCGVVWCGVVWCGVVWYSV